MRSEYFGEYFGEYFSPVGVTNEYFEVIDLSLV